jgi:ornithine cyclodeaminase/alanine dehydrogenase-like protein (mu-crystallin family)
VVLNYAYAQPTRICGFYRTAAYPRVACLMRYLSGKDLLDLMSPMLLISAIEEALRDFACKQVNVPMRQHVHFGENTLLTMSAIGKGAFGVKIVSVVPSNAARHLPVTNGLMLLSDVVTGLPLAVLDAAVVTAQRTGAVGAVALKYTTPPEVDRIGIIGVGVQGTWQVIFACAVRRIRTVYFITRSDENAHRFVNAVSRHAPSVCFSRCGDVHELLANAQIVITATTSSEPVLPSERAPLANKHFISVGSFKSSMQELPSSVYHLSHQVVVDSDAAKFEVGDLIEPLSLGLLREENVIHIADVLLGNRSIDVAGTTVFKSIGMALYDLYAARAYFAEAQRLDRGTSLET